MNLNDSFLKNLAEIYVINKSALTDLLHKHQYFIHTDDRNIVFSIVQDAFVYNADFQNDLLKLFKQNNIAKSQKATESKQIADNRFTLTQSNKKKFNYFIDETEKEHNRHVLITSLIIITLGYICIKKLKFT